MTPAESVNTTSPKSASLGIVILAAGQGKRMKSRLPKVLHAIAGEPMLARVIDAAKSLSPDNITLVYGHGGDIVRDAFAHDTTLSWAKQEPQLGTGHAVLQAMPHVSNTAITLVLYGDVPLIQASTLATLVQSAQQNKLAWLTMHVANPFGLGRIVRDASGNVSEIVEEKDAKDAQRAITEINTGFVACPTPWLAKWLPTLGNRNAQGEYYLTDILKLAVTEGRTVETQSPQHEWEVAGVNSRAQLAELERTHQMTNAKQLMDDGVTLRDPARVDVRGTLTCEADVTIDVNVIFEGSVTLKRNVIIGANCILRDCTIDEGTEILPFSHIEGATIGKNARVGPYARLRPGTTLADDVHIGNFVEVKASDIDVGSKANHLSYIGDATIGRSVNVGAGTITCNYDGANKHRTIIEDNVHIGSDVQLIAPVTVKANATIGAGTTVWKEAPADALTLNPKQQTNRADWVRPTKKKT
jgi:bifunctional UDP-N-acetylglucosamine pyrophosphorylase / glucosamine-1-phosphate N-acetyltransferase